MSRASTAALELLHTALAEELSEQLKPHNETGEDGKERKVRASAAVLAVVAKFLKDNGIDSSVRSNDNPLSNLAKQLREAQERETRAGEDSPV